MMGNDGRVHCSCNHSCTWCTVIVVWVVVVEAAGTGRVFVVVGTGPDVRVVGEAV